MNIREEIRVTSWVLESDQAENRKEKFLLRGRAGNNDEPRLH